MKNKAAKTVSCSLLIYLFLLKFRAVNSSTTLSDNPKCKIGREKSYWNLLENPPRGTDIMIVRAENSDRWGQDAIQRIQNLASRGETDSRGKVSLCVLPNAGHWVHVDNPKGLLEIVAPKMAFL